MSSRRYAIDLTISRLASRSTVYFVLMGVAFLISSVQTLIYARYLSATSLGLLATALTVAMFGGAFQLGLLSALTRELPVAFGAGMRDRADRLVGTVTWALMALGAAMLPVYLAVVFFALPDRGSAVAAALALGGVWAVARAFSEMVLLRLRSERELIAFPVTFLLQRLAAIALGALAARQFDFEATLMVFIGVDIVTYIALSFFRLRRPDYRWPLVTELRYLVSIGFPMMLAGVFRAGQVSGEKLLIVAAMDASDLGIYQVAWTPVGAAIAINGVISQYLGPKILQEYGGHRSVWRVFKESSRISFGLLALGLAASPLALLLAQPFVDYFVAPEFSDSAEAMRILYFSGVIMVANMFHMTMFAANRPRAALYVQIAVSAATLAAYAVIINVTSDIVWVAVVSVGGMACDFIARFAVAWLIARGDEAGRQPGAEALAATQPPDLPVG